VGSTEATAHPQEGVASQSTPATVEPWKLYSEQQRWWFLAVLFLVTTCNFFDYYVLSVLLEPIKAEFHVSDTALGLLSGFAFAFFYALAALPLARWADRGNRRSVMVISLTVWSAMTALCGLAQSFVQLALARLGLGLAEPGALPPAHSLVADYFPTKRRATAISLLSTGGAVLGWLMGVGVGGYVAATHGWRAAFLVAGVPGLGLAVLVRFVLQEPRARVGFPKVSRQGTFVSLLQLRTKRSFVWSVTGMSIYAVFAYGVSIFLPSFMMRDLHATLAQVSVTWGITIAGANLVGALLGGWLADRLSARDVRWYVWLAAIACVVDIPVYWLALDAKDLWSFIGIDFFGEAILSVGVSSIYTAVQAVCGNGRRAMASAALQFSYTLFGAGCGPLIAGALSDAFGAAYGAESLRYSLMSMLMFLVPAAIAFHWSARSMKSELEDWGSHAGQAEHADPAEQGRSGMQADVADQITN